MNKANKLFEIADRQQGYFTAGQAKDCGYYDSHFQRYLSSGEWIKVNRGLYRLSRYPLSDRPDLIEWSLWSRNKQGEIQGVWSHETALELYELSDVMPAKMHMTVPKRFRKGIKIPENLVLYFADLLPDEIREQQGYRVTTPLKTIIDVAELGKLSEDLIVSAIQDALRKGILTRRQLQEVGKCKNNINFKRILHDYKF